MPGPEDYSLKDKKASRWRELIEEGEKYKEKFAKALRWKDFSRYAEGDWKEGIIGVNRTFSMGRALVPRTYFKAPSVTVTARRPEFEWHARVVETVDNWLLGQMKVKKHIKAAILNAYIFGTGILKIGYDSEFGYLPEQKVLPDGETVTQQSDKEKDFKKIEYRADVQPGMPWVVSCHPADIVTPWGYTDPEALPWVCHKILRPLEDVKEDSKYNSNRNKVTGGYQGLKEKARKSKMLWQKPPIENYALLYEIRDLRKGKIIVLCEDKELLNEDDALQIRGQLPFEFIVFNPRDDCLWGLSDVGLNEHQQKELNDIRTQAHKHRRLAVIKFLYKAGALTQDNLERFLSDEVGIGVEVGGKGIDEAIAQSVMQLQGHIPPDLMAEARLVMEDWRETLQLDRNQAGILKGTTPPTATEVDTVQQGSDVRSDERRDIIADMLVSLITKVNMIVFKYWDGPRIVQIVGPDGAKHWIEYSGQELQGDYVVGIDPESGMPITRQMRYGQAREIFGMLNGDPYTDQLLLRKLLLRQHEWIDPMYSLLVNPQTNQMPQEVQMRGMMARQAALRKGLGMAAAGGGGQ